ncbi:hypothetical protein Tco_0468451 [Tanacetum coccineum]
MFTISTNTITSQLHFHNSKQPNTIQPPQWQRLLGEGIIVKVIAPTHNTSGALPTLLHFPPNHLQTQTAYAASPSGLEAIRQASQRHLPYGTSSCAKVHKDPKQRISSSQGQTNPTIMLYGTLTEDNSKIQGSCHCSDLQEQSMNHDNIHRLSIHPELIDTS